jgi:hypothetical protein
VTSLKQIEANRANAQKSTGPITDQGKQRSRCNAVRHGLTADTVIGALEDAEDYRAFEDSIITDYDAQSAVERELVRRLAGLLWRLRRATMMETGLFEIQADYLTAFRRVPDASSASQEALYALFTQSSPLRIGRALLAQGDVARMSELPSTKPTSEEANLDPGVELARCFLRLANLPNFALDRLSRYEATLWRQAGQVLFALNALDRRQPQERRHPHPGRCGEID